MVLGVFSSQTRSGLTCVEYCKHLLSSCVSLLDYIFLVQYQLSGYSAIYSVSRYLICHVMRKIMYK